MNLNGSCHQGCLQFIGGLGLFGLLLPACLWHDEVDLATVKPRVETAGGRGNTV